MENKQLPKPGTLLELLKSRGGELPQLSPRVSPPLDARPAAVVAPLVLPAWDSPLSEAKLLFIKRSEHLKKHAGQMAFPGGTKEDEDPDLLTAGLREGHEEVGLDPNNTTLLAPLPKAFTPTGFHLHPFFVATTQQHYVAQESEVDSIHLIAVDELLRCPVRLEQREWLGKSYRVIFFDTDSVCIWGVTGRITEVLLTHFFDWRAPDAEL